jgi:hypothetical protein
MRTMDELIQQWKRRARRKSIAMISFVLVQLTATAALVWRMAAKSRALHDNANAVAVVFLCVSASYPVLALLRVIFVPSVLDPDAVVPPSLLREISQKDVANAAIRAGSRAPKPAGLTFRELLELDRS